MTRKRGSWVCGSKWAKKLTHGSRVLAPMYPEGPGVPGSGTRGRPDETSSPEGERVTGVFRTRFVVCSCLANAAVAQPPSHPADWQCGQRTLLGRERPGMFQSLRGTPGERD